MEIESANIPNGESGAMLEVSQDLLYQMMTNLRSEMFNELDELSSGEFAEASAKANEINSIMEKIEDLCILEEDEDEDEYTSSELPT
jgi:hypothetical protein